MNKFPATQTNLIVPMPGATATVISSAAIRTLDVTGLATFEQASLFEDHINIMVDQPQLRLSWTAPNYAEFSVNAAGLLTITATGHGILTAATNVVGILNTTESSSNTTGALQVSGGISAMKTVRAADYAFLLGSPKRQKVDITASLMGVTVAPAVMTLIAPNTWAWALAAAADTIRCSGLLPNTRLAGSAVTLNMYWAPQDAAVDDIGLNASYSFNTPGVVMAATATDPFVLHTPGAALQCVKSVVGTWTPAVDTDAMFHCEIVRTGDYVGKSMYILGVELIVEVDKLGGI